MEKNNKYRDEQLNIIYASLIDYYLKNWDNRNIDDLMVAKAYEIPRNSRENLDNYILGLQQKYKGKTGHISSVFDENILKNMIWEAEDIDKELDTSYFHFILSYCNRLHDYLRQYNYMDNNMIQTKIKDIPDINLYREAYADLKPFVIDSITMNDLKRILMFSENIDLNNLLESYINSRVGNYVVRKVFFQLFLETILDDAQNNLVNVSENQKSTDIKQYTYCFGLVGLDKNKFTFDIDSVQKLISFLNNYTLIHNQVDLNHKFLIENHKQRKKN